MPCKNVSSGICGQWRQRSAYASMQSDQGLHCLLAESLDATESMKGEQMKTPWYFGHVQGIWICMFCACSKAFFSTWHSPFCICSSLQGVQSSLACNVLISYVPWSKNITPDKERSFNRKVQVLIFFLFLHKNIYCLSSLEAPHCGASSVVLLTSTNNICFCAEIRKKIMWIPSLI